MFTARRILVLLSLAALAFAPVPGTAAAKTAHDCHGLHLSAPGRHVAGGGSIWVRGRLCERTGQRARVLIVVKGAHGWRRRAKVTVGRGGHFHRRIHLGALGHVRIARLRAVQRSRRSNAVAVRLDKPDATSAPTSSTSTGGGEEASCTSSSPQPSVPMTMPGCGVIASDTTSSRDPVPFWGAIECASASRYSYEPTGGDHEPSADGSAQPDDAYRRLTVDDGDNFWGERCELGENNWQGPTAFYHEGQRRITYYSERLPSNFPIGTTDWQTVMQMKQAEPMHDDNGGVALEMQVMGGRWYVMDQWKQVFSFPAQPGVWTRFAWDVYYSSDPSKGWLQVSADLNGDGDFDDPGEQSPVIHLPTLVTEIPGHPEDGLAPGSSIPSHLRLGVYHDPAIPCPAPNGCSIDVDNVQVLG
jgi:hypothetical protein